MIEFIYITVTNLMWILYSMSEAIREAIFYHYKNKSKRRPMVNYKTVVNLQRIMVLVLSGSVLIYLMGWISIPLILAQLFMFKYFHRIIFKRTMGKLNDNTEQYLIGKEEKSSKRGLLMIFGVLLQVFIYLFLI